MPEAFRFVDPLIAIVYLLLPWLILDFVAP